MEIDEKKFSKLFHDIEKAIGLFSVTIQNIKREFLLTIKNDNNKNHNRKGV